MLDVVVLTDARYLTLDSSSWYSVQLHQEDAYVVDALKSLNLQVARKAWDDPDFDWSNTRSVLFRTTWDYFERFDEFAPWLQQVQTQTQLFNSQDLIHWNIDKRYLLDLERKGVNVVKTYYFNQFESIHLETFIAQLDIPQHEHTEWILKPAISGNARHTYRFKTQDANTYQDLLDSLLKSESMMLQPFVQSVLQHGEYSLIYLNGHITHAIRKTPKEHDFRVQDDHGGVVHTHAATEAQIQFATQAIQAVPFDVIYARVDLIEDNNGQLAIMELEMIEPELFFRYQPNSAFELAQAIQNRLNAQPNLSGLTL